MSLPTTTQSAGEFDPSNAMIPVAFVENRTSGVVKSRSLDWNKLSKRLSECDIGEKDGSGWMPADIDLGQRTAERVKSVSLLVLDVEADAENVKDEFDKPLLDANGDNIKRYLGPEPPAPDAMVAELGLWGMRSILHTSYSHNAEHPRYRLIFALSRPLVPAEIKPLGLHVAALIGIADCIDTGCLEPARLFYLPRCPTDRQALFRHAEISGNALSVDELISEAVKITDAQKLSQTGRRTGQSGGVIEAFNTAHDVGLILEQHGYQPKGSKRWLWAGSTSGLPGVRLLTDSIPDRVYSSHGGDPLNDGHAHNAFDLWRVLRHRGDTTAAVKDAAQLLGIGPTGGGNSGTAAKQQRDDKNAPASNAADFPEPSPLPKLPPVPDFAIDLLPDDLQAYVADCAVRARYRPEFAAVSIMAALGSVIGRKLGIRLKANDDWTEYANVWGGCVGLPSSLKSPSNRDGTRPFKALQVAADQIHRKASEEYSIQSEAFKLRKDARRKSAAKSLVDNVDAPIDLGTDVAPDAPVPRTYWTSDATAAKLGELLAANPNGLLVERDELSSLLSSLEDEANADARGLYLSGWSGKEGYRFDRIARGTVTLPKFAISVVGGIQPGPLTRYVRSAFSGERADGLLQRFQLLVWPDAEPFEYVDRRPDSKAKQAAMELFERADTFDPEAIGQHDKFGSEPPFVRLSEDAQKIFVEWFTQFMQSARSAYSGIADSGPLAAHFGKYPGLVGKLALIFHVADDQGACEVSAVSLCKALAWIDFLTPHARRVYHAVEHPETGAAELLLMRLKRGELPPKFKAHEISRKCWHGLSDRESVKKACRLLFEYGWLIELDPGGASGGRPTDPVYTVSPKVGVQG